MAMHSDDDYMVTEEASVGYQKRTLIDHVNLHVKKGEILTPVSYTHLESAGAGSVGGVRYI